jgi:integrase
MAKSKRVYKKLKRHPYIYEYETENGKHYRVRWSYYDSEHKRQEFTKNGFNNWQDAEVILRRAQTNLDVGNQDVLAKRKITLGQYYAQTRKRSIEIGKWRPETVDQKDTHWKNQIEPIFGNMKMSEISRAGYQNFIDNLVKKKYAYTTIKSINSIVQLLMNRASLNDVIDKNRLKSIIIEGAPAKKTAKLEPEQYQTFIDTARKVLNKYQLTLVYLCAMGARREEVIGLRYNSFKFFKQNNQEICEITYNLGRNRLETLGGPLKNESSYRQNYVTGEMADMLKFSIQYSKNICQRTGHILKEDGFLFLNEQSGMPVYIQYPNRLFKKVENSCHIHVYPHLLRHYFATMARSLNLSPTDVMHWLGHSSLDMTDSYTRPTQQGSLKVINGMQDVLFKKDASND